MNLVKINCAFCDKQFFRPKNRVNEARKFGHAQYCSKECKNQSRVRKIKKICANSICNKLIFRAPAELKKSKSGNVFCSLSCAAIVNNSKFPKRKSKKNKCKYCKKEFMGQGKYCSRICKHKTQIISRTKILEQIKEFYRKNKRIPLKREFRHCKAARMRFGTWNKAVEAAGFVPNPVMFARKYQAQDGHKCDSLSEKIIDGWFYKNHLSHKIKISYPRHSKLTCDFVVGKYYIEFFGLEGEHKRYTELVKQKRKLARRYRLNFIELKPKHVLSAAKLNDVLGFLRNSEKVFD